MRIALVVPGGVDRSGEYRVIPALLALLRRLAEAHDVQVFALRQEAQPASWQLAGAQIHNIGVRHTRRRALRAILAAHGAARFDVIQSVWSGSCSLVAVTAGRLLRVPTVVHVAGGELVAMREIGYGGALSLRGRLRERLTLRAATAVSAASAPTIALMAAWGVRAQRVPLGVDRISWPARAPARRDPARPARLLHVASLNRVKDQSTLLRALTAVARSGVAFQLDVVGEDTLGGQVQRLARDLNLSDVVSFRGFLPQRLLRPLVESADVLLISSRHETGPVVVLEAAMAGVPTVGTAVGHIAEWAPEAAIAVPPADSAALAAALVALLQDEEQRLRIARRAQCRALLEDADHTARAFTKLYTSLTTGATPSP
jgi:glycosyltransferase involved in cell wall biosynthesis